MLRKSVLSAAFLSALILTANASRSVTLEWDASPDADITGYRVQYGTSPGAYTQSVEVPNTTTAPVAGLAEDQTYYFVVKAVNAAGLISDPSNEVALPSIVVERPPTEEPPPVIEEPPPVVEEPPPVVEEPPPVVEEPEWPTDSVYPSYETWSAGMTIEQRQPYADPDRDGITNLAEYALGRDALRAETKPVLDLNLRGSVLTVSFSHPAVSSSVRFALEESGDLAHWQPVTDVITTVHSTGVANTILRDVSSTRRVFYRLQVVSGVQTAITRPYGVQTVTISGTTGATGPVASTMFGLSLTRPVEFSGDAESVSQDAIHDAQAEWQDGQYEGQNGAYLLEITSGSFAGTTYDIVATSAAGRTLRVAQNFPANLAPGFTYQVRKHWTMASVFGAENQSGLSGEDRIIVWNGSIYRQYYYQSGIGWRNVSDPAIDAADTIFYPEDGLTVQRRSEGNTPLLLAGEVKRTITSIPVPTGTTMLANVYAGPMTLNSSRLFTGDPATGVKNGTEGTADQVLLWDGTRYRFFYYRRTNGWREINGPNNGDAGSTEIPAGGTVTIIRSGNTGFNWLPPVHPAGL